MSDQKTKNKIEAIAASVFPSIVLNFPNHKKEKAASEAIEYATELVKQFSDAEKVDENETENGGE